MEAWGRADLLVLVTVLIGAISAAAAIYVVPGARPRYFLWLLLAVSVVGVVIITLSHRERAARHASAPPDVATPAIYEPSRTVFKDGYELSAGDCHATKGDIICSVTARRLDGPPEFGLICAGEEDDDASTTHARIGAGVLHAQKIQFVELVGWVSSGGNSFPSDLESKCVAITKLKQGQAGRFEVTFGKYADAYDGIDELHVIGLSERSAPSGRLPLMFRNIAVRR